MHDSVRSAWHEFSTPFEGRVHSLYVDVLGLVTTGVGNLVDPVGLALKMPWRLPDGSLATADEVRKQWNAVKAQADFLKKRHWKYAADVTTMRLTDEDIDKIVQGKLAENEAYICKWLPDFPNIPADAQLGILSLAWAAGPGFNQKFPNFTRSALAGRWADCAVSGQLRATGPDGTPNPGVIPRNKAQKLCFENAAAVVANGADVSVLHWPNVFQVLPIPEDDPPLSRRVDTPEQFGAAAAMAAVESRFVSLDDLRRDANRQMAIDPEPAELSDEEEPTRPDLPGTVPPKGQA